MSSDPDVRAFRSAWPRTRRGQSQGPGDDLGRRQLSREEKLILGSLRWSNWYLIALKLAMGVLLVLLIVLYFLLRQNEADEQRSTLIADVLWLEQSISFHPERNAEHLENWPAIFLRSVTRKPCSSCVRSICSRAIRISRNRLAGFGRTATDPRHRPRFAAPWPGFRHRRDSGFGAG